MIAANLKINKECIVRDRPCGRVFSCSNTCFVACATSGQVGFEIDLIKTVLLDEEVEPYIAVENFVPAKDIFCTKICTKIIESKFCIVLLSGVTDKNGTVIPNPNVYYEYGLMTAWDKYIIPLLRGNQKLAFNIQSLDTIKYSPNTFKTELGQSVRLALASTEVSEENEKKNRLEDFLILYFELNGFTPQTKSWIAEKTHFLPFQHFNFGRILYNSSEMERVIIETKIIARRLERYVTDLDRKIEGIKNSYEKANTVAQQEGTRRQLVKTEKLKESVLEPKITVVTLHHELKDELNKRLDISETILNLEINILSYDEINEEIGKMK